MISWLFRVSRPRFWLYLAGTYLVGAAFALQTSSQLLSREFLLFFVYFLLPANLFLYGINDLFDQDTDRFNPKKEAKEYLHRAKKNRALWWAVAVSALLGVLLAAAFFSLASMFSMLLFLLLGAAYSVPPFRLKAVPFLDALSNVLYAIPGFLAYAQFSGWLPGWPAFVAAWCWTAAMHAFSAVPDIVPDRKAGLETSATFLGARNTLLLCTALWLCSTALAYFMLGLPALLGLVYPIIALRGAFNVRSVKRLYWWFPWINSLVGFGLFFLAIQGQALFFI